jgi:DNA (cytosine-5)-methyltransferase 1
MQSLGWKPRASRRILDLGNPTLLNMAMSEAAKTFDVGKPQTRRDKKSGARKRKQYQIEVELAAERL